MQTGDAVFYYPCTEILDTQVLGRPRLNRHIGLVECIDDNGTVWIRSKLGFEFGVYKHKVDAALPWYGMIYKYRRPNRNQESR